MLGSLALAQARELHQAARVCDADRKRELLSHHPLLNELDENGMTPLHVAIEARQDACVRLLLEAGADRNARDRQGRTAVDAALKVPDLHDSKVAQDWRAIVVLLWRPDQEKPRTPLERETMPWSLEYAAMHGQTGILKMLLDLGADPNAIGKNGTTPLADVALKGDRDGVHLLLAHGARVDAINQAGTQPIHDAALGDNAEIIRELATHGADINARTRDDAQTPLHIAAAMGKMKAIRALVALGADLTIKDSSGRTALDVAERAGLTEVVAFLRRAAAEK